MRTSTTICRWRCWQNGSADERRQPDLASPQHEDYEAVNGLLNRVMQSALQMLATGVLGELAQDTGKIGRILAFWDICRARDLAWEFADHLRGLEGGSRQVALVAQDQMTGALGRAILAFQQRLREVVLRTAMTRATHNDSRSLRDDKQKTGNTKCKTTAGPSTAQLAKCASYFAQDDTPGDGEWIGIIVGQF